MRKYATGRHAHERRSAGRAEDAAPAADRPFARPRRGAARQARQPAGPPAAGHPYRRHQRQGLHRRLPQGHAAGRRQARAHLHLAASGALPRAHRARRHRRSGAADRRGRAGRLLQRTQRVNAGDAVTFFEITTAAAFLAFAERPPTLVLEVGLGGRLDATNVVARPALSRDHAHLARPRRQARGHLADIAGEKAGILKRGVTAVVSRQPPERWPSSQAAAQRSAPRSSSGARISRPSSSAAASSTRAKSG